jgi:type IVB pilus formation R64 PilN family outer membrane protein
MKSMIKITAFLLGFSLVLTSCAIQKENSKKSAEGVDRAQEIYKKGKAQGKDSLVSKSDQIFISDNILKVDHTTPLPPLFKKNILYTTADHESLTTTISNISKLTKQSIVLDGSAKKTANTATPSAGMISYRGKLELVLTQICDKDNLYWSYKKGVVTIFSLETKMYELDAPVGSFSLSNKISSTSDPAGSGGSSSVGGNSSMSLDYTVKADSPWSAAVATIKTMLSTHGKLNSDAVEGFITITDTPKIQKKVDTYVQRINNRTNKKIAVRVDVYDVQTDSSSDFGFDVNSLVNVLSNEVEISNDMTGFLNANNSGSFTAFNFKGTGNNSNVILDALNTIGKASEVTGTTVYTVSGQPAPIQSTQAQNYLASVSTQTTDGTVSTTMEPGTVVTGYSMTVMPRLQSNRQILVNLDLQISSLIEIQNFSVDGSDSSNIIQLPKTKNKNFLESMVLQNGQSILIAGFQDDMVNSSTASPTTMDMWGAGGAKTTQHTKSTTVIVVTPYIIGD